MKHFFAPVAFRPRLLPLSASFVLVAWVPVSALAQLSQSEMYGASYFVTLGITPLPTFPLGPLPSVDLSLNPSDAAGNSAVIGITGANNPGPSFASEAAGNGIYSATSILAYQDVITNKFPTSLPVIFNFNVAAGALKFGCGSSSGCIGYASYAITLLQDGNPATTYQNGIPVVGGASSALLQYSGHRRQSHANWVWAGWNEFGEC